MVGSSKILTVSYGTFSCTLEGFDDSFSTMKAIAEYFRDLASDDRYFGAEPPTPDAEMLARIAEREITRRVEARTEDGEIVLRASEAIEAPAPEQVEDTQVAHEDAATSDVDETKAVAMPPVALPPVDVQPVAVEAPVLEEPIIEAETEIEAVVAVEEPLEEAAPEPFEPATTFADMDVATIAQPTVPAHPAEDSVAAKLQRIRAVVGNDEDEFETNTYAEDLNEAFVAPEVEVDIVEAEEVAADVTEHTIDDVAEVEIEVDEIEADVADIVEDVAASEDIAAFMETAEVSDDLYDDMGEIEDETDIIADADEAAFDAPVADDLDAISEEDTVVEAETEEVIADETVSEEIIEDVAPVKPTIRARIVRLARATPFIGKSPDEEVDAQDGAQDDASEADAMMPSEDDVAAEALDDLEMMDGPQEDETAPMMVDDDYSIAAMDGSDDLTEFEEMPTGTLSDEDEADLQQELAEVAQDIETTLEARRGRDVLPDTDDAAMSRIMTQTDAELSEPEGNRRRNAIAQLKAAVAATEAARQLGDDSGNSETEAQEAFRDDLDHVVRPNRPVRPTAHSERPRPAPLKLVAAQRVDAPAAPTTPVLPRRIAAVVATPEPSDASSFAEFAEEMGATELPDLLEAAAAYTAFVEGIEDFSRPQIMKKVQMTIDEEFSREDGLRSFGTLLRQGRISKVRNGRFQVSEQTRFRPEQRSA